MPVSRSTSSVGNPKPVNIFYIWYGELCRRLNTTPVSVVKPPKPKHSSILDFVSDRIKPEEWPPILNALRLDTSLHVIAVRSRIACKFLDDVDTENKVKCMKRKFGSLWTAYILDSLVNSLASCLKRTEVLSFLELEGLPIMSNYLEKLLEGLQQNKTIRRLSLNHCPINDNGCQQLCMTLRFMPNIEVLNISSCGLSALSCQYIANLIRYQQINRYCESWHSSLRYEDPEIGTMAGIKRITLNNNPDIGDDGLRLILNELDDDLWIKAVDMQRCGLTERVASRLIDVIDYSRSLEVADFRNNDLLSPATIEKIFNILKDKNGFGYESEFQWCLSTSTLIRGESIMSLTDNNSATIQKSKSAPFNQPVRSTSNFQRSKTFTSLNRYNKPKSEGVNQRDVNLARKQMLGLSTQLKAEIKKRTGIEEINKQLQTKLDRIKRTNTIIDRNQTDLEHFLITDDNKNTKTNQKGPIHSNPPTRGATNRVPKQKDGKNSQKSDTTKKDASKNGVAKPNVLKKSVEFVFPSKVSQVAQNIFENFVNVKSSEEPDDSDEEDLLALYCDTETVNDHKTEEDLESVSNASLLQYVEEIKLLESPSEPPSPKNGYKTSQKSNIKEEVKNGFKPLSKNKYKPSKEISMKNVVKKDTKRNSKTASEREDAQSSHNNLGKVLVKVK